MTTKRRAITLGLSNQKGGVAKTTSAAALAAIFAERGLKVLAIDNDPQAHLSVLLGVDTAEPQSNLKTVSDVYQWKNRAEDIAIETSFKGVWLVPASVELASIEMFLPTLQGSDVRLSRWLDSAREHFDLIILDSPPNLGKLAINVLAASDWFLVPVDGPLAMRSVGTLVEAAEANAMIYQSQTQFLGVFLTIVDKTVIMQNVRKELEKRYPGKLFDTTIRRSTLARESSAVQKPVSVYASDSAVSKDYRDLAAEIAQRLGI